ncbi:hypothetical protein BC937DRAFT_89307 [Endogone sp. FLAS-F59071]|nr:hypothetical protein BC937DRAFT_89307 [Endogone sp. FLAS-F59071]|eukprot:RUS17966.1 hypothetical protein BC937DRAFT_89307 [Endogone sp. FLAS-F59071]
MTFNFWYQLALALSDPQYQDTKTKFEDVYDRIVDVILVHLRYPDELARWTGEERDEFRNFRHIMGDTLKDCCIVLGARTCLSKPYDILTRILGAAESAGGVEAVLAAWQDIEAAIFSLRAMGAEVPDTESEVMPQIMEMLGKLPDHPKIRYAATLVISRYSGWTKLHPQFIEYQLNFISVGFENEEVAAASALALKHLCRDCSELLVSFLNQLHPFFLNVTKTLPTQDVFEVTEAVAHVIAAIPTAELFKALQLFCLPVAQRLHEIALLRKDASDKQTKEASELLEQITLFLQVVTPDIPPGQPHPCVTFVRELWPVFDLLLDSFGNHPAVSESLCKCFKYCVVSYRTHFIPLLPQLMERLVTVFDRTQLSCYLWVATKVVREYANEDANNTTNCLKFMEGLSTVMFGMLPSKQFSDIPDVIEEYFRLIVAFLDAAPTLLIQSPLLSSVFHAGLAGLNLEQQDTLTAVLSFYRNLISVGYPLNMPSSVPRTPLPSPGLGSSSHSSVMPISPPRSAAATANATTVQSLFRQYGLNFVQLLFNGLIYHFPRDVVADVAAILKMLAEMLPQDSAQWMVQVVEQFPEQHMTAAERASFLTEYTTSIQDQQWKRVRRVLSDFVATYRRKNVVSRARRIETPCLTLLSHTTYPAPNQIARHDSIQQAKLAIVSNKYAIMWTGVQFRPPHPAQLYSSSSPSSFLITTNSEEADFIKLTPKKHLRTITIGHWQLRDLLLCPTNRKEIIYPFGNSVLKYNTEKKQETNLLSGIGFDPTSIAAGHGYIAAGGQKSELVVRKLDGTWEINTSVGNEINNALSITERPGEPPRLMVCTNDEMIMVYSLPSMRELTKIQLPTAVNYGELERKRLWKDGMKRWKKGTSGGAVSRFEFIIQNRNREKMAIILICDGTSVSPDGRKMVAVGDSNHVFLFDISASGQYKRVATYTASTDSSFSCSWNQASDIFAVASQDGIVSVWDIRSSEKLCQLGSKQHPLPRGATRCVKFTQSGSLDLLAFSEHTSYIDIVDARTFNSRQALRVVPEGSEAEILGMTFTPDSQTLFVGT